MSDRKSLALLTLLLGVMTLPFVRRAYFVDDYYFVTMAKGILKRPTRPYDFVSDDAGIANPAWERGKQPRMVNPPLFHYFLAAIIAVWGDATWKLRTASLIFPLISLFVMYFLGKRFVRDPLGATLLLALTPAFWLNAYALLIDSAMLAFFLLALWTFIEGQEKRKFGWLVLSGTLMGLTLLTKYTGFLILPVVLVWHAMNRDRSSWGGTLAAIGTCMIIFFLWGIWGILTYGQMHFTATLSRGFHPAAPLGLISLLLMILGCALRWAVSKSRWAIYSAWGCWGLSGALVIQGLTDSHSLAAWLQTYYLDKEIAVASFLGGCSVFLFFVPVFLWKRHRPTAIGLGVGIILLFICFASRFGGFSSGQSAQLAFFVGSTLGFLLLVGQETSPTADRNKLFGVYWLVMGLLELILVMPWTAGRYLLLVMPPVCWLFQYFMEDYGWRTLKVGVLGSTALLGLALAYVDYAQANVIQPLAQILETQAPLFQELAPRPPQHWYYLADTFDGSQPYVLRWGWENVFPFQKFPAGSLFLRSYYRKSSWWKIENPERFQPVMVWDFDSRIPLRVMDVPASAGFYASCWGSLPYAITRHPLERFELCLVK
jgi:4-amino-4-deoxy-L-arabinose transferase-like glycosyltransferase